MADATTMTTKGQVTVPREIRDRLGLKIRRQDGLHDAQRRHRRHAAEDAAPGGLGGLAHAPRAAQGRRRGHEPVQGDDSQFIDEGFDEATCAMSSRATTNAARAAVPSATLVP